MKPFPPKHHLAAAAILAAAATVSGLLAFCDDRLSDTQVHMATAAVKRHQPHLLENDPVFGRSQLWRYHAPALQAGMELLLVPTGFGDLFLPFRAATGALVLVLAGGMYLLVYRQTKSWSAAVLVAMMATIVVRLPGQHWGAGPLWTTTPSALVLALAPLAVYGFLRYERRWQLLLVFAAIGLLGNVHLPSALNLTLVLLVMYLGRRRFAAGAWPAAGACLAAAVAGALPYAGYYAALRLRLGPSAEPAGQAVHEALDELNVLYPRMLEALVDEGLLARLVVLSVVAAVVLWRFERYRLRDASAWAWMLGASAAVGLGLHGLSQLTGRALGQAPPLIDLVRALALAMIPLYVLLGQAITNAFRIAGRRRVALWWGLTVLLGLWVLPSENLRVPRHASYRLLDAAVAWVADDEDRPPAASRRQRQFAQQLQELQAVGRWAAAATDERCIFISNDIRLRALAGRGIVASREDVRYFYYMAPALLGHWAQLLQTQQAILRPPTGQIDPKLPHRFVSALSEDPRWSGVSDWYLMVASEICPEELTAAEEIAPQGWGSQYRVFRIQLTR